MNSFDLLRLLAALCVILHHCAPLAGLPPRLLLDTDFGELGVAVFFVISGYLVTGSLQRSASITHYLQKRLLRIEPALLVSVAVVALVVGAAVTSLPLAEYLGRPQVYLYIVRNTLLYPVSYELPGVFEHNPVPHIVNGSLWTLRLEVTCYLGLAALGWMGLLTRFVVAGLAIAAAAVFLFLHVARPDLAAELRLVYLAALNGFLFLAGALLQLLDRRVPAWALVVALGLMLTPAWIVGLPVLVVALGRCPSPRLPADVSYGLYIYAFPLQQILASAGHLSFAASVAVTAPVAVASWFLVEKPALRLKRRHATPIALARIPLT